MSECDVCDQTAVISSLPSGLALTLAFHAVSE